MVIGPRGAEVDKLREELEVLVDRKINVNVVEIKEPAVDATLVAQAIAEQVRKRSSFRRVMKQQCEQAIQAGAKGVKIVCSGRLGGAEMSRKETQKLGSIPLQTLDANVDYAIVHARTTYGVIGIKVWVYLGKFGEEAPIQQVSRPERRGPRGPAKPRGGPAGGGRRRKPAAKAKAAVADTAETKAAPAVAAPEPKPAASEVKADEPKAAEPNEEKQS